MTLFVKNRLEHIKNIASNFYLKRRVPDKTLKKMLDNLSFIQPFTTLLKARYYHKDRDTIQFHYHRWMKMISNLNLIQESFTKS